MGGRRAAACSWKRNEPLGKRAAFALLRRRREGQKNGLVGRAAMCSWRRNEPLGRRAAFALRPSKLLKPTLPQR